MIKINKSPEPDHLRRNKAAWTADYVANYVEGETPAPRFRSYYNHQTIRDTIISESHEKCAYCEAGDFLANSFANVEHIQPFSKNPELAYEWLNLILACTICNNKKRAYNGEEGHLVNPVTEDPAGEIKFAGPAGFGNSARGRLTIDRIDLNRIRLIEKRMKDLQILNDAIIQFQDPTKTDLQHDLAREELKLMLEPDKPFSQARFWFAKLNCPELFEEGN